MKCEVCAATVTELRRGRCWGCYNRWVDARPVGLGAQCTMCGERRRELLKSVEILGAWMPCCYNCTARAMKLEPLPQTVGEIRDALTRDRRRRPRRGGKKDTRVFKRDRRNDDRRTVRKLGDDDFVAIDDEMIVEIEELAAELSGDNNTGELTRIHQLPLQPS